MDSNAQQIVEINLKDLFFVILKKILLVVLVGVVCSVGFYAYKSVSNYNDANVLDITTRLENETEAQYSERVLNVQRAEDIICSINSVNGQIDNQRQYVTDSLLMQIDAQNEAVTTAQFLVTINDNQTNGVDKALVSSYAQDIKSGEYLGELAESLETTEGYLKELITVSYDVSSATVIDSESSGSTAAVVITVIAPTSSCADSIMDCIVEELDSKCVELNETVVPHTVSLAGIQSFYMVDNNTRDLQYNAINRFEVLQKQIETYDLALDDIASQLGVGDKSHIYEYISFGDDSWVYASTSSAIKFAVVGFAIGAVSIAMWIAFVYVFGKKFSTQAAFFSRFPQVKKIGVIKPSKSKTLWIRFIDRELGDDNGFSDEHNYEIIAANIHNLTTGMEKVLFTGTIDLSRIKELVAKLNVSAESKESVLSNPSSLDSLSGYDGVILVEQRNHSDCRLINEELALIANADTKLIGVIIV